MLFPMFHFARQPKGNPLDARQRIAQEGITFVHGRDGGSQHSTIISRVASSHLCKPLLPIVSGA
jgi:hypothetical protein